MTGVDQLTPTHPSASTLEADVLCLRCRYNLRGIDRAGNCPECGYLVADTLTVIALFPDLGWLRRLRIGIEFAIASQIVAVLMIFVTPLAGGFEVLWVVTLLLLPAGLALVGAWLFSTPEPSKADMTERYVARSCAVALMAFWLITLGASLIVEHQLVYTTICVLAVIVAIVGVYTAGRWAGAVAQRLNRPGLASLTQLVGVLNAMIGCSPLAGMGILGLAALTGRASPAIGVMLLMGALLTAVAFAALGLVTWGLMIAFRVVLAEAVRITSHGPATQH